MPDRPAKPQGLKIFRGEAAPKPKKFPLTKLLILGGAVLALLLIAVGSVLVAASYLSEKAPLVSVDFQRKVDYLVASVPLVPKTNKQILTRAAQDSENIQSAKEKFELKIGSGAISLGSLSIEASSDSTDINNTSVEARVKGKFGIAPQVYELDLSLTQIADNLYFKLDKTPDALFTPYGYDPSKIRGKWYQIDTEVMRKSISADTKSNEDIQKEIEGKTEEFFDFLDEENLLQKFQRLPDEKIASRESYHLLLSLDKATLVKIFHKFMNTQLEEGEVSEVIEDAKLDLWVDKSSFFVNKMEATIGLTSEAASSTSLVGSALGPIELKVGYELSEINQKVEIEAPGGATKINSLSELFILVAPTDTRSVQGVLGASSATAEFGSNVIFLERLIHVVTLFPSSI